MHPITALMLARQIEEERRRMIARRHRFDEPAAGSPPDRRRSWIERIRLPRLGLSTS